MQGNVARTRQLAVLTLIAAAAAFWVLLHAPPAPRAPATPKTPGRATPVSATPTAPDEIAEKLADGRYRLGKAIADTQAREVTCEGRVNMTAGALEYLAVTPFGKRHESLLELDVRPLHLQLALILIGLEPRGGLTIQGDERPPLGDPVRVLIAWTDGDAEKRIPAEQLVRDVRTEKPMPADAWIFSGSLVDEQGFSADTDGSLIGIYRDPIALINNVLPTGADDTVYEVFEGAPPPLGTPVQLILQAVPPADRARAEQ